MHAANLLNKRRQREEQLKAANASASSASSEACHKTEGGHSTPHSHRVSRKTNSQTSFLDSIAVTSCSTPINSHAPRLPTLEYGSNKSFPTFKQHSTHHFNRNDPPHHHSGGNTSALINDSHQPIDPLILYHKPERISCAHIGLCVMIVGTIVTIIAGFIGYLLGFAEPGVIIGCGGGIITVVGLILLCCGNRWHLDEMRKKFPLIENFHFISTLRNVDQEDPENLNEETERVGDRLDVSNLVNMVPKDN